MASRLWCAACLALGAGDLAVINLVVGPRVLPEVPLVAAVSAPPGAPATVTPAVAPLPIAPIEELRRDEIPPAPVETTEAPSPRPAATPELPRIADQNPRPAATPELPRIADQTPSPAPPQTPDPPQNANDAAREPVTTDTAAELPTSPVVVYFATDRATLWPAAQLRLDEVARALAEHDDWKVQVSGHTDSRGSDDHNAQLSRRRVRRVREYLEARGVTSERLVGRAFGEQKPIADGEDDESLHRNRRVELIFTRSKP